MDLSRNPVLVHSQGQQGVADFKAIRTYVEEIASDLEVFGVRSSSMRKKIARRPTLVFSPHRLLEFRPDRGKVYQDQSMYKLVEMERLTTAGLPVSYYQEIVPDTVLSAASFGAYTIVKPAYEQASWGKGIELLQTEAVRYRAPSDYPPDYFGRKGPMMAGKSVDLGFPMTCRVLTLFGIPLCSYYRESNRFLNMLLLIGPFGQRSSWRSTTRRFTLHTTRRFFN